jgi:hypothetical protein
MVPIRGAERQILSSTCPIPPETPMDALTPQPRWWLITRGLLRAAVSGAVMVALYYVLPLHARSSGYVILERTLGLVRRVSQCQPHVFWVMTAT